MSKKVVQVSDPRQKRILKRLGLIGPGPAAFYQDACTLMKGQNDLLTVSHLVAHLLREIESSLRDVVLPQTKEPKESSSGGKHKAEILATLRVLGIPKNSPIALEWLNVPGKGNSYGLSARAHRDALNSPRLLDEEFRSFFDRFETLLDIVLDSYEAHYLESHQRIDELLAVESPDSSHIRTLSNNIPNNLVALSYFFDSLDDDSWLELLDEGGYFSTPPEPEIDLEDERVLFPQWPQSRYLARVAANSAERAYRTAIAMPDSDNIFIQEDLTEVALALEPSLAKDFAPKALRWLSTPYRSYSLPAKLGDLVVHLLKGNEVDEAFVLVESLLAVSRPTSTVSNTEPYLLSLNLETNFIDARLYQKTLNKLINALVNADPEQTINLFCQLLDEAVTLSTPSSSTDATFDTSYLWRPSIEEQDENQHRHLIQNALTSALVDAIEQVLDSNAMLIEAVVILLEEHNPRIFERLILHIIQQRPNEARTISRERIVNNTNYLVKSGIHREYALLLQQQFGHLPEDDQLRILDWIEEGPDRKAFIQRYESKHGETPPAREIARHVGEWQRDRLSIIVKNAPRVHKERYDSLVNRYGPSRSFIEPDDRLSDMSWSGSRSPKSFEELDKLSTKDLIDFLQYWQGENPLLGPTREGLLDTFSDLVSMKPSRFLEELDLIKLLSDDSLSSMLTGILKAIELEKEFSWDQALDLFALTNEQTKAIDEETFSHTDSPIRQSRGITKSCGLAM